jgi:hypothetical protein
MVSGDLTGAFELGLLSLLGSGLGLGTMGAWLMIVSAAGAGLTGAGSVGASATLSRSGATSPGSGSTRACAAGV